MSLGSHYLINAIAEFRLLHHLSPATQPLGLFRDLRALPHT